MGIRVIPGSAHPRLAEAIGAELGMGVAEVEVRRFPDGEMRPEVGSLRDEDVYVVQPTGPPVAENLVELLLLLDACRRAGAGRVTAVVPYLGYARQDRRATVGEALGVRVVTDALVAAGAERLVVVDPHLAALEAVAGIPTEVVSAVGLLADAVSGATAGTVVLAPDLGAVKLAHTYASRLGLPVAAVQKHRIDGTSVRAEQIMGDVEGLRMIVVDDMISTGATIRAAVDAAVSSGGQPGPVVVATHGLLVGSAGEELQRLRPHRLVVTDTTPVPPVPHLAVETCSVAPLLADTVRRLHGAAGAVPAP